MVLLSARIALLLASPSSQKRRPLSRAMRRLHAVRRHQRAAQR
jgi:hypothetical protein